LMPSTGSLIVLSVCGCICAMVVALIGCAKSATA
jgi:hypothetical protein